jgi:dihydrofolate synthase/folylpolyglutamate synthase
MVQIEYFGERMINTQKQSTPQKGIVPAGQKSYSEVIEFLDANWALPRTDKELKAIKALDKAMGNPSKALPTILIGGTNGKGLTINFASCLLKEEGLKVGAFYSPHVLTYNERFALDNETISNKAFTELANEVIGTAQENNIKADTLDILCVMAFVHFKNNNADVAILEMSDGTAYEPLSICAPGIVAITRITDDSTKPLDQAATLHSIKELLLASVKPKTFVISADQSKTNLQNILEETKRLGGTWSMPIRKLAALNYPFEQLHGRCAALAERISHIFIDNFGQKEGVVIDNSLLAKQRGQRGRPTLEAKRQAELHPKKTIDQFWKETATTLPAHFQILDKEKPTILLDNASNVDAIENLLLGIRLLHYQRPLKGLTFIFGCDKNRINTEEFTRLLRYFSKKNSANIIFCPIENNVPGVATESWDVEQITNDVKSLKIKARSASSFEEAFDAAKKSVDERHGLVVITGSQSIVSQYWHHKGIKKL